jgi:hypothetical protein
MESSGRISSSFPAHGLAVRDWDFRPALKDGIPVAAHCPMTFEFQDD